MAGHPGDAGGSAEPIKEEGFDQIRVIESETLQERRETEMVYVISITRILYSSVHCSLYCTPYAYLLSFYTRVSSCSTRVSLHEIDSRRERRVRLRARICTSSTMGCICDGVILTVDG